MRFQISRRQFIDSSAALMLAMSTPAGSSAKPGKSAAARVIVDNDFAGDPDGLFQLAHHLLCTSVDIPIIIGITYVLTMIFVITVFVTDILYAYFDPRVKVG